MRVIGMISGTSFDAIEAVAVELELDRETLVVDFHRHLSVPYPPELRSAVAELLPPATTSIEAVCRLDTLIGAQFAEVAERLSLEAFAGQVDVVCSHGQTVFHWVEAGRARGTLQLGQPAFIAERTGATVVSDLRARDIAKGGHGAPLASLLDVLLFAHRDDRVYGSLNLGGIANVTVAGAGREPLAYDIGPANALLDAVVAWRSGGAELCDLGGERAGQGRVDAELLDRFLDEPYYGQPPPKSTGKELFHLPYVLERLDGRELATEDLLATLTALSAEVIARDLRQLEVAQVVSAGGGTRNLTLMRELSARLPGVSLVKIDAYGVAEGAKEALVFALIGFLTVNGLTASIPSCTGAREASVLGSIVPGARNLKRQADPLQPTRLRVRTPLGSGQRQPQ